MRRASRVSPSSSSFGLVQRLRQHLHQEAEHHHLVAAPHTANRKGGTSALARIANRLQAAYERLRLKNLPPQLRSVAAATSINTVVRSESDIANVVEQRIWHSAIEGDFEKLPGKGKPLKVESTSHGDPAEDLMYRILSQNGFAPEWVELNKEIRFQMERWRRALRFSWKSKKDGVVGDVTHREALWTADLKILEGELKDINKKVFNYNLIVPFGRQVYIYKMEEELREVQKL